MSDPLQTKAEPVETGEEYHDEFIPKEELCDFLGVRSCRIVFRRCRHVAPQADGTYKLTPEYRKTRKIPSELLLLDYTEKEPRIRKVSDNRGFSPLFSPGGDMILYTTTFHVTPIFVEWIDNRRPPIEIATGSSPSWWTDPDNGDLYVIFRTESGQFTWPQPGVTLRRKIDRETGEPVGEAEQIYDKGFGGGLTPDGRWLVTGFTTLDTVDMRTGEHRVLLDGERVCNVTVPPDTSGRIMALRPHHAYFSTTLVDGSEDVLYKIPEHLYDWHTPKWTNHPDYAIVVASTKQLMYDIYAYRLSDRTYRKIVWGDTYIHPHMWMDTGNSRPK